MAKANDGFPDFLDGEVNTVAQRLLGCEFERQIDGHVVRLRIVETESYDQEDTASHAFGGQTKRNSVMYGPAGHLYVYFTYGMHYCCNVVTGHEGYGSGVLIRAVEPIGDHGVLSVNRSGITGVNVTNGPAKLCQALGIDMRMSGHDLRSGSLRLISRPALPETEIIATTRVGISKAKDAERRFYIKGNPYVSKK